MSWRARLTQPLTPSQASKVRLQLVLIPVYIWLGVMWPAYAISNSPPGRLDRDGHVKGSDFVHFYVLGEIANADAGAELYDFDAQSARTDGIVPEYPVRYMPVYGPQVAMLFAPLARMPYESAVNVWLLVTAAIYVVSCYFVWTTIPALRRYAWAAVVLIAGYPAVYWLIASGHISALALACVTVAYFAFRSQRPFLAGLALGSLCHKPALGVVLPFVFVYAREWRVIVGAVIAVVVQVGIAWVRFGTSVLEQYAGVLTQIGGTVNALEPGPYQMHSLRALFSILLPWPGAALACYLVAGAIVIAMTATTWKSAAPIELRYGVLLVGMLLVDPHVNSYDLVVMAPAFVLLAGWAVVHEQTSGLFWAAIGLSYYLPAFEFIARTTHIQASVIALLVLMIFAVRAGTRPASPAAGPVLAVEPDVTGP